MVREYIYKVIVMTKHNFNEHPKVLGEVLQELA